MIISSLSGKKSWFSGIALDFCLSFFICIFLFLAFHQTPVLAKSILQDENPVVQCKEGGQLALDDNFDEAFPLLKSGFTNRKLGTFTNQEELGICGLELGNYYAWRVDFDEALATYTMVVDIFGESGNFHFESVTLTKIGKIYEYQSQYSEALEYYQKALALARKTGNRTDEGKILNIIAVVYDIQGKYYEALDLHEQALAIAREVGDQEMEMNTLGNIGTVYIDLEQRPEALKYFEQSSTFFEKFRDRDNELSTDWYNIASLYQEQGQYTKALWAYQQSLEISREVYDSYSESDALHGIGMIYVAQGLYDQALDQFQQALIIRSENGDRVYEAITLENIGSVYDHQGKYIEALEYYQKAKAIENEGGNPIGDGTTLNDIGAVYYHQDKYEDALSYYQQALVINKKWEDRVNECGTLNNIGAVYEAKELYSKALDYYQQALMIEREISDPISESNTLENIGTVYDRQGKQAEALMNYMQALKILQSLDDTENQGNILGNIGKVYQEQKKFTEALSYYEKALKVFEALRSTAGDESARTNYSTKYANIYNLTINLYYEQNQFEKAFLNSERGRARSFLDSMVTGYVELSDNASNILYEEEQETYAARLAAQNALNNAKAQTSSDPLHITYLETELSKSEAEYQAVLDAISAHGGQLEQLVPARSTVLNLPQTQELLDSQTTLLSFWVLDDQTLVFILTQSSFNTIALPISRTELYAQIETFRTFTNTDTAFPDNAVKLYNSLIEPIKPYLTTSKLVIVPNGKLHYLPFSALTDGSRYLIDDYSITYLPSVSSWPYIKKNIGHSQINPLIFGNPATNNFNLSSLPYAEREAQAIANLYQTTPVLEQAATETDLRAQIGKAGILHLAAHGSYNPTDPLDSTIYLTPDNTNDGLLKVSEIYGLDLNNTDLVVLSDCNTQLGQLSNGDEIVGMTRAFLFAGTPSVLASLWPVDDRATQLLMEKFYTNWRSGMSKEEALQKAQIETRIQYPNPYYWAAFVLSGDGTEVGTVQQQATLSTKSSIPGPSFQLIVIFCCVGVIILAVVIIFLYKITHTNRRS